MKREGRVFGHHFGLIFKLGPLRREGEGLMRIGIGKSLEKNCVLYILSCSMASVDLKHATYFLVGSFLDPIFRDGSWTHPRKGQVDRFKGRGAKPGTSPITHG